MSAWTQRVDGQHARWAGCEVRRFSAWHEARPRCVDCNWSRPRFGANGVKSKTGAPLRASVSQRGMHTDRLARRFVMSRASDAIAKLWEGWRRSMNARLATAELARCEYTGLRATDLGCPTCTHPGRS